MANLVFKRFDTYPPLGATLSGASGVIDLSNASAVFFSMKSAVGTVVASMVMASVIATAGYVQHNWVASETSMADTWQGEFEIHWKAGGVQTVPNDGTVSLIIEADLEDA